MAGGTWTSQNKVRPGVYINFESSGGNLGTLGERGTTSLALSLPWGPAQKIITIQAGDDVKPVLGYDLSDPVLLPVREALKRAQTLLLWRHNTGEKATATVGGLTATAKYGGVRGNDLKVVIQTNIDNEDLFDVVTVLDGKTVHEQTAADIGGLTTNDWLVFSGTGALTVTAGAALQGGANGTVTNADHTAYLAALELEDFQTVALISNDNSLKSVYSSFIRRLRDDEGKKVQAVVAAYPTADSEGIISVKNGVILSDGTSLTAEQATAWVAGATAAAAVNESLTNQAYDDAVDANPRYTNAEIIAGLQAGEFLFTASNGAARVEQDINTFHSFTPTKGKEWRKNRVVRVLDGIANDFKRIFETFYLGKVDNNPDGRNLLKSECINYLTTLQGMNAIQNFDSQSDVTFIQGDEKDAVYSGVNVQPVDSVEKIYMKVKVK